MSLLIYPFTNLSISIYFYSLYYYNSTFTMIERLLSIQPSLLEYYTTYPPRPTTTTTTTNTTTNKNDAPIGIILSVEEWILLQDIYMCLCPLYEVVKGIRKEKRITASLPFLSICAIEQRVREGGRELRTPEGRSMAKLILFELSSRYGTCIS